MTTPMREGDLVAVTVTKVLPFGLLVQSAEGVAGLVRAVHAEVGAVIDVQVREFDGQRFAATVE
ncbi:MAG TPA: hypothetical protein VIU11_09290 [Nakamurella sp.]